MMRPMKLGGEQLVFGEGCLAHLRNLEGRCAVVITSGIFMTAGGILDRVKDYLREAGMQTQTLEIKDGEPDLTVVLAGTKCIRAWNPDWIIALGGGSVMDAAKAIWIFYEHEELQSLNDLMPPNSFPKLRTKARICCIPSTSGTGSEVSRSIVITDPQTGMKCGLGNMEMVPDVAICDPAVTLTVPAKITAETGMDAITHALEALVSTRANLVSDILAMQAVRDVFKFLPKAYMDGTCMEAREKLLNASLVAGLAFTNVSLGIVHSMAHTLGSYFHIAHGLANAVILPYIIRFNKKDERAAAIYKKIEQDLELNDVADEIFRMNRNMKIPMDFSALIPREAYERQLENMARAALEDGCTKTSPVIPGPEQMAALFGQVWSGKE